jgi:hypothetical protein
MGDTKSLVRAVAARLAALGFSQSGEVFNFQAIPDSVIDKSFRIETRPVRNQYHSGEIAETDEMIDIWIAYDTAGGILETWEDAIDNREEIELDLINAESISSLPTDPLLAMDPEASIQKYLGNYLVQRISFKANHIRDVSPG